ncbi:MAG: hypothetical protein KJO42_08680, partial [Silicimonas sp.]|nr:hypothetical protein [Silicimonas sp.]
AGAKFDISAITCVDNRAHGRNTKQSPPDIVLTPGKGRIASTVPHQDHRLTKGRPQGKETTL